MKLGIKLISAFAAIASLIALSGYVGSAEINHLYSAYYREQNELLPAVSSLGEIKAKLPIIELEPSEYLNEPELEHVEELEETEEYLEQQLSIYGQLAGHDRAEALEKDLDELFAAGYEIIALKDADMSKLVLDSKFSDLDDKLGAFSDKLDTERDQITQELGKSTVALKSDIEFTYKLTIILATIAAAIAVIAGVYVTSSISKPISKLTYAADQIGKGNYDAETNVSQSSDEIGMLCVHFGNMKDELRNKEKMQNEFISVASHELRTPIQPILAYAELAIKGTIPATESLKVIEHEGKRLLHLASDILDVTRIEGGRMSYHMENIKLNDFVSEIARTHQSINGDKNSGIHLNIQLQTDSSLSIYADRMRMAQVMNNIVGNAVKFTSKGMVSIETNYVDQKGKVRIKISDTGPGIHPDVLPRIFGKFVSQGGTINNQQGSGLGLFISKSIIETHGGRISASNNPDGIGASVTITMPVHTIGNTQPNHGTDLASA